MKYNIEPIMNKHFSCQQALLATYAAYQNRSYDMIFAESWGFKYEKDDYPFGQLLDPGYQNRREILLKKFHGIKTKYKEYKSNTKLMEGVKSSLLNSPVILYCDVFYCPWNISYRRNHIDHYILITGMNDKMALYVIDPYSTQGENCITVEALALNKNIITRFKVVPEKNPREKDYLLELNNCVKHLNSSNAFLNMDIFLNEFITRFDEVVCSEYTDVYAIPLIINLNRIANQRFCFCIFLKKMVDMNLIDPTLLNLMKNIAEKYSLFRMLLIKQIMKKKVNSEGFVILKEIIDSEHRAYECMRSTLRVKFNLKL